MSRPLQKQHQEQHREQHQEQYEEKNAHHAHNVLDTKMMRAALSLARSAQGSTFPNPPVGCIIAHSHEIIAFAATAPSGRPHAETKALAIAGNKAKGATLYSTLEPCTHKNIHNTPPCCQAIVSAKIARTCYPIQDPDPRTNGACKKILEKNNIIVTENVCPQEASQQLEPYLKRCHRTLPHITLKLAISLDGKISETSQPYRQRQTHISGAKARIYRNNPLRQSDAILIGAQTMRLDNPKLLLDEILISPEETQERHPFASIRIILDGGLTIPLESNLVQTVDHAPLWILTRAAEAASDKGTALKNSGVRLIPVPALSRQGGGVRLSLIEAMHTLAAEGIASILCEGGAKLAHELLSENLADRMILFSAPHTLGAQGLSMLASNNPKRFDFQLEETLTLDQDEIKTFRPQHNNV